MFSEHLIPPQLNEENQDLWNVYDSGMEFCCPGGKLATNKLVKGNETPKYQGLALHLDDLRNAHELINIQDWTEISPFFSVSLFSPTGKKFYVNLTLSNIIRVYTPGQTFPALTSSRSVSQPLKNPPFSPVEFETLESECLRSNSPPVTPIPTRHNRVPNQLTPSSGVPAQQDFQPSSITLEALRTSRKPPVQKDSQINASSSSDASEYRIRPSRPSIPPSVTNRNCQTPVRSGLGSLLRGSTHSVSTPEPTPDTFIRPQTVVAGPPAVDKLLNDARCKYTGHVVLERGLDTPEGYMILQA
ncbi:hypothetical protein CLF_101889 [Clonorchis sinensis]|uniref:Uncharacterized protein n=1 Tax=Clonorchis sinensis TaxID=79923 RepID=G7Y6T0_CLOSI|nr:hypothetical protein CLF_101889 [Clonorchis sinensis]